MKRNGYLFIILFLYTTPILGIGKDNPDSLQAVRECLSPLFAFGEKSYANPALQPYARQFSLSSLRLSGEYKNEKEAVIVQQGSGYRQGVFRAESYLHLNPRTTVWGHAGYRSGKIKSVCWNETSDFELLYPYIMADTAGGDLNTESYTFCGGYSRIYKHFSWGLSGDYRAMIEYRKTDPRPRNIVSDLKLSGGAAWQVHTRYLIGAAVYGRIYRQRNSIKFFSDLGVSKVYQMLGLGMYSTRFSDGNTGIQYDGGSIGGGIDLVPHDRQGFYGSVHFHKLNIKRTMLAHNYLPLTRLNENSIQGTWGWKRSAPGHQQGIHLEGLYHKRKGTEFIYGEGSSSNYPKINDLEQYSNKIYALLLNGIWGWGNEQQDILWVEPRIGFRSVSTGYLSPSLSLKDSKYQGGLSVSSLLMLRKSLFRISIAGDYFGTTTSHLDIDRLSSEELIKNAVRQQYENLKSDFSRYELSIVWNRPLNHTFALSTDIGWQHCRFRNHNYSDRITVGCSLKF